ncbi:MAG: hypothetical protein RIC35_13370 [Marinoscillum sp.]
MSEIVPRRNLGTIVLKSNKSEAVLMSAANVLIVEPSSFVALMFKYDKTQQPNNYVAGLEEFKYADDESGELIGATIMEEGITKWTNFNLVVRYIDEEGVKISKIRIDE